MDYSQLLRRLSDIENAVGVLDSISIRRMIIETQEYILHSQKRSVEAIRLRNSRPVPRASYFSLRREAS
jgi:hypothetical protein